MGVPDSSTVPGPRSRDASERVFSAESELRHPLRFAAHAARDLADTLSIAWVVLVRNIRGQYRQTALGLIWAIVPPLATTLCFVLLQSQNIVATDNIATPYGAYVMVGSLLWQGFADAVASPSKIINSSLSMLSAVRFPREALILAGFGECVFYFLIRLVLLFATLAYYDIAIPPTIALAPLGIMVLLLAGLVVGLILVPLGILYHDIDIGLSVALSFWFIVTPIVYAAPEGGALGTINALNPVTPLLTTTRDLITTGTLAEPGPFLAVAAAVIVLFVVALAAFRLAIPHIVKRVQD
jgi:lipopolysaccharide transport system permease protein